MMGRVYARLEDTGERILIRLECDRYGCRATIRPNPNIANSGWVKRGISDGAGGSNEECFCPEHTP